MFEYKPLTELVSWELSSTLTYWAIPNVVFPLVTITNWKLLPYDNKSMIEKKWLHYVGHHAMESKGLYRYGR